MSSDPSDPRGTASRKPGQEATREQKRLNEARESGIAWKKWGPYLSERQWGTVREDYSPNGDAWDYFTHDQSRSRAYRWGEDGLGGFSDDQQRLCFALALWNGKDPILKERLFGLTNAEGNHGEDVKEYYFYLDSTPTHSYMKYLYKYPQGEFPYRDLVETNARRSREELEYELLDTEGLRRRPVLRRLPRVREGGPGRRPDPDHRHEPRARSRPARLPTLWFRNTWSWKEGTPKPSLREARGAVSTSHPELGDTTLCCDGAPEFLFTENESNLERLWGHSAGTKGLTRSRSGIPGIRARPRESLPFILELERGKAEPPPPKRANSEGPEAPRSSR